MHQIDVRTFAQVLADTAHDNTIVAIDVRSSDEFARAHIAGVQNVPLNELEDHADELQGKRAIYVHCRTGARSKLAIEKLMELGINATLFNVEGGIVAWEWAGFPTQPLSARARSQTA